MRSFQHDHIRHQHITPELVATIRQIGTYQGKEDLYAQQSPEMLETLRQVAIIQSTESSNRIEGVTVPAERFKELMAVERLPARFRVTQLEELCPGVSRETVRKILNRMKSDGKIKCVRRGPDAEWAKKD